MARIGNTAEPGMTATVSKTQGIIAISLPILLMLFGGVLLLVPGGTPGYQPARHAFLEYFGAYLGACLFAICVWRHRLQGSGDYLLLSAGFLTFSVLQVLQIVAYPGFHDLSWLPTSPSRGEAFDISARLFLGLFLFLGALHLGRGVDNPTRRKTLSLFIVSAVVFVASSVAVFAFLPKGDFTSVSGFRMAMNWLPALFFAGAALSFLRARGMAQPLPFWFLVGSVLLAFSCANTQGAVLFQVSHLAKIAALTAFLFGFFLDQTQFLRMETELRESLKRSQDELAENQQAQSALAQQLRKSDQDLEIMKQCLEHATEGLLILDRDKKITYANAAFKKVTGFTDQDLLGTDTAELIAGRGDTVLRAAWETVEEGRAWHGEFYRRKKDRSTFVGEVTIVPISENGEASRYLWSEKDITRRKALEKSIQNYTEALTRKTNELETSKAYYKSLISGMSDILLVVDNEGQCTFINDYGVKQLGLRAEELSRSNLPVFFDDLKRLEQDYGSTIQVEIKDFEAIIKTRDGKPILCSWYAQPLFDRHDKRIGAMAVGRDITEYKRLQNELEAYAKNLEHNVEERTRELKLKVDQLARLLEIGEEIRLNVDIDVILNKVCEAVQALGWRKVIISLRDEREGVSRPVATAGLPPAQIEEVMSWGDVPLANTEKFFKEEFRISNSYYVPHSREMISKETPFSVFSELGDRKADEWHALDALLVPIRTRDKILGVISVDDPVDKSKPNLEKVRDLEIFADKAVLAMENARLFQIQKEGERRAKFLAEMSQIFHASLNLNEVLEAIVNKGGRAIGDVCSLLLLDESGEFLRLAAVYHKDSEFVDQVKKGAEAFPCKLGEGLIGGIASGGQPFIASTPFSDSVEFSHTLFHYLDRFQAISSVLVVPLRARGRLIGTMVYLCAGSNRKYKEDHVKLTTELADRAALAIENARLFKEAGEKAVELEKANKMKSEFLANVSHELRTPLNAIITLADILIREFAHDEDSERVKQLRMIQRSGRTLLNLINDILDLSKIESGRMDPIYESVPIQALIEDTVEHIRPLCTEKGLKLEHHIADDVPEIAVTDPDKVTKALTNILSNAVKFTHRGKISVEVTLANDSELTIEIADTGIGIPEERYQDIFKEFEQVDSSDSKVFGGTGLGLAITRKVLAALGGSVSVRSRLGKGSTFSVRLPLRPPQDKMQTPFGFRPSVDGNGVGSTQDPVSDDRERLVAGRKSVLLIDDDEKTISGVGAFLQERNYQIILSQNREDVIELAKRYRPYAIILDLLMPSRDGWEILRELKQHAQTQKIPVIVTSTLSEQERAFELGATEYIAKPFEPQKLLLSLSTVAVQSKRRLPFRNIPRILKSNLFKGLLTFRKHDTQEDNRARVMLVDDDQDTLYTINYILEGAGYNVFFANEGREALEQIAEVNPDLILMDIMMPGMDGYETTRRLKAMDQYKNTPIVAMTAKAMKGDREKTLQAGCDDYIAKPFLTEEILRMVEKWLYVKAN